MLASLHKHEVRLQSALQKKAKVKNFSGRAPNQNLVRAMCPVRKTYDSIVI